MKARRLRWHGASRQQALFDRLQQELTAWLEEWSVHPALLTLRLNDTHCATASEWRWMRATSKVGSVLFGSHSAAIDGLGGLLANAAHHDALGLGGRVGLRALRALLTRFVGGGAKLTDFEDVSPPTAEEQDPRFGGCGLLLQGEGFEARLIVDNSLFEFWVPPQTTALPALAQRASTLGNERVALDVVLDLGNATLADAHQLQVGDVLISNASIDSVFHLALPDARRLFVANLVRSGGRRALQVDASTLRKNS